MRRGDIYWVNLDPTVDSEIRKKRPCVLISATPIMRARKTVVVVPLSSSPEAIPPLTVAVRSLGKTAVAVCDQMRTIDKQRLVEKAGVLGLEDIMAIEDSMKQVLCL